MILEEFNEERFKRNMREEGYEDGWADGKITGQQEKAIEAAENLLRENIATEIIARCTGLPLEKVQEIAERISAERISAHA